MQNKTRKIISAFLTLAMILGLFWAMAIPASAEVPVITFTKDLEDQEVFEGETLTFVVDGKVDGKPLEDWIASDEGYGAWQLQLPIGSTWGTLEVEGTTLTFAASKMFNGVKIRYVVAYSDSKKDVVSSKIAKITVKDNEKIAFSPDKIIPEIVAKAPILNIGRIVSPPEDSDITEGESTSFHIEAIGFGYQWEVRENKKNSPAIVFWKIIEEGGIYSDVTTDTLILTEVPLSHDGYEYRCLVTTISGDNLTSESAKLTVTAVPTAEPGEEEPPESATEPPEPTEPPPPFPFTDVVSTDWFYNNVKTAWEMGLVNGKTATTYEPTANLTYAEAVKLAACMHQYYQTGNVTLVIGTTNWYDTYVAYAKTNGIISKDYEWNAYATRAGYMEIFANALPDAALGAQNSVANGRYRTCR